MKTLRFKIVIGAQPAAVWNTMLDQDTYRIWTSVFIQESRFEGSWEQGERIRFLDPDGNGMTAVVAENRRHEFVSVRHLGIIKAGVDDTESEAARSWAPSFENYRFSAVGSSTEVEVAIDVPPKYEEYMARTWPLALAKLREICEAPTTG